ncbi:MAG: glycoside hydrolase family 2 TIM barrel-domain containing protein, partial [Actinomycetota bacterium]
VVRWSAGTWIEDQDHWYHGGLHRSVELRSAGSVALDDVQVRAALADDLASGRVDVEARVEGGAGWSVEAEVFRSVGARRGAAKRRADVSILDTTAHLASMGDAYRHPGPVARLGFRLDDVRPWSHEDPHLGRVDVRLLDPDGVVREVVRIPVGFRRVEVGERELRLNGVVVPIAGVNRHDHDPATGKVMTAQQLRAEAAAIKAAGFNALRTAHYPPEGALLDACDEIGLWVICEANVESHARWRQLNDEPAFQQAIVGRSQRMAVVHGNHPSVMSWSLGNESGHGPAHDAAAAWLRHHDPTRWVHYEGAIMSTWLADPAAAESTVATDVICPMYPSVDDLVRWATTTSGTKPLVMCEYSHAMGNSNGGLADYWAAIEAHHGLQGGFIWDWRDQGLGEVDAEGRHFWAYGGHFDEPVHDGDFCCNGLVGPDGAPRPAIEEHRWLTRPVRVTWADEARTRLRVTNRRSFTDLSDLRMELELLVDGEVVAHERRDAPPVGPGESTTVPVKAALRRSAPGSEASLLVTWRRRRRPWWDAGVAPPHDQLPLAVVAAAGPAPTAAGTVERTPLGATAGRVTYGLSADGGLGSILVGDRELLAEPVRLAMWRAPIDNDGPSVGPGISAPFARPGWLAAGLDRLRPELVETAARRWGDEVRLVSRWRWHGDGHVIEHRQTATVLPTGAAVIDEDVRVPSELEDLPRVGVRFALASGHDRLRWFGPGPHETYADRCSGAVERTWASTVAEQDVPYVFPQHHGTHVHTRWCTLTDRRGRGVRIQLDGLAFDASHHRVEDLTAATTIAELRPTGEVHVHVDAGIRGVGTGACGPDVAARHRIGGGRWRFRWGLAPLG